MIVALQSNGKISQKESYTQIRDLWKNLKESRKELLPDE